MQYRWEETVSSWCWIVGEAEIQVHAYGEDRLP